MNKKEVLNQLKSLHYDMEHFQEIESKEEDVKAFVLHKLLLFQKII